MTGDLQKRTQYGQQAADSDAEVVVQYLSKRLVKRKTCAGTDGKDLFRPLLTIVSRSSSSFLPVFYHVLPMVVRVVLGRMPQVSFFYGHPSLPHPPWAVVVDMCMRLAAQCFETSV